MAKTKAAAAPSTDVTVPRSVLRQFVNLVDGLEQADNAYKACQTSVFRDYAHDAVRAPNVQSAVSRAREILEATEESPEESAPEGV